jgi:hypothetical protein
MLYVQSGYYPDKVADELEAECLEHQEGRTSKEPPLFDEEFPFDDGTRMVVQVLACDEDSAWSQAVLFDERGNELACTGVEDGFLGDYWISLGDHEYVVQIRRT